MNTQLLSLFTHIQVSVTDLLERAHDDERGQTFVEWLAVMAIILLLITAFAGKLDGVAQAVATKAADLVKEVG